MIRSAWPFSASRRSPLVSVSANSTLTTSSLIIVLAPVGPRPVYSRNTPTASLEISAAVGPAARCSSIPTPLSASSNGYGDHERERKRWSPACSTHHPTPPRASDPPRSGVQAQQPQRPRSPTATIVPIAPAPGGIDVQAGRLAPDVTNEPTAAAADPRPGSERDGGAQESALGDRR